MLAGLVLAIPFIATAAPASADQVAPTTLKINEVESSAPDKGADWIELMNTGAAPLDISGYILKDNKDDDAVAIPAGTSIAAGGFFAQIVDDKTIEGNFGLGGEDSARLYMPDGTTELDSYAWTTAAANTYGRCPDGTGAFVDTNSATMGAANDCDTTPAAPSVKINEVESNGDSVGDWIELINNGSTDVDVSGWVLKDNKDSDHYVIPDGTVIPAGGYDTEITDGNNSQAPGNFGLGGDDSARLYLADGTTLVDSYSWTTAASTTYGRCPNGTGDFTTTGASTKNAENNCDVVGGNPTTGDSPVKINEIESSDPTDGPDWVEFFNTGTDAVDLTGYVVKDNDDSDHFVFPAGSTIAAGGFLTEDIDAGDKPGFFGLGGADSVRFYQPDGTTLLDTYTWTEAATTTYGRCADGTGDFVTMNSVTKNAANDCPVVLSPSAWPGSADVATADVANTFGENMSGLAYEGSGSSTPGTLWAVKNGPGTMYKLNTSDNGKTWIPDTKDGWGEGKKLNYPNGMAGDPDSEGVTFTDAGPAGGVYVSTERNNDDSGVSRPAVLRFDPSAEGTSLDATEEWNLTADLPGLGANLGLEAITWVPDSFLVSKGFLDEHTGAAYDPSDYADHGDGLFFVGVEQDGMIYAYALGKDGAYDRIAAIDSGFPGVMELKFDENTGSLWATCDDTCEGQMATLQIGAKAAPATAKALAAPAAGSFAITHLYARPASMPNINNEGFAWASDTECVDGTKPAFWTDDGETDGHALRTGTIACTDSAPGTDPGDGSNGTDPGNGDQPGDGSGDQPGNGGGTGDQPGTGDNGSTPGNGSTGGDSAGTPEASGSLPRTGAEVAGPASIALLALVLGGGAVLIGRRKRISAKK